MCDVVGCSRKVVLCVCRTARKQVRVVLFVLNQSSHEEGYLVEPTPEKLGWCWLEVCCCSTSNLKNLSALFLDFVFVLKISSENPSDRSVVGVERDHHREQGCIGSQSAW